MSLTLSKENGVSKILFSDTQRISQNMLSELLACNSSIIASAATRKNVVSITGPRIFEDLPPTIQYKISDLPKIISGLQEIITEKNVEQSEKFSWSTGLDVSTDFKARVPSGYTIVYRYNK